MILFSELASETLQPFRHWIPDDERNSLLTGIDDYTLSYALDCGKVWLASEDNEPIALVIEIYDGNSDSYISVFLEHSTAEAFGQRVIKSFTSRDLNQPYFTTIHESDTDRIKLYTNAEFKPFTPLNEEGYRDYISHAKEQQ